MAPKSPPNPPESLGRNGKRLWRGVLGEFEITSEHHLELLTSACTALDRAEMARKVIDEQGIVTTNRHGEAVEHPAARIERASLTLFRTNLRELGLDLRDGVIQETRGPRRAGGRS